MLVWNKKFLLAAVILLIALLALLARNLYVTRSTSPGADLSQAVDRYVKAVYARDFNAAYLWLAATERQKKDRETYAREQGAFAGFTLKLATKLASFIETQPAEPLFAGEHVKIKFRLKLPDVEKLTPHVLEWDENKLNSLSLSEQDALIDKIEQWHREARLPVIHVEENFEAVREESDWRIVPSSQHGVKVEVLTKIPSGAPIRVDPTPREIVFQPGEPFTVTLKLKNLSNRELRAKVAHNVEPPSMAKYLGLGDCGSFVAFRLAPRKEEENRATFLVWTDIPKETERFAMIYEFEVDKQ